MMLYKEKVFSPTPSKWGLFLPYSPTSLRPASRTKKDLLRQTELKIVVKE